MKVYKTYTGIGSRNIPSQIEQLFVNVGKYLANESYCLRSGGASGSDQAFERGVDSISGYKEIYLPWKRFENNDSQLYFISDESYKIAKQFHPRFDLLSFGAKKLIARDGYQVLGYDLLCPTPSDFVICYTENASGSGGTGQALRIAKHYNIPIFDCGYSTDLQQIRHDLMKFLVERFKESGVIL